MVPRVANGLIFSRIVMSPVIIISIAAFLCGAAIVWAAATLFSHFTANNSESRLKTISQEIVGIWDVPVLFDKEADIRSRAPRRSFFGLSALRKMVADLLEAAHVPISVGAFAALS